MQDTDRDLLPEGLEDRLPQDAAAAARVTRAVLDVLDGHGYNRVQPPSIEFEKSMASRMAGVQSRRMFRFVDPASLRTLALRSDMTVQVGRIAATALGAAARPLRLCYAGQVVTIKGDGLDPARERLQLGAELIGSDSVAAAGEVVAVAIEALQAAGAKGISIDFTLPNLVSELVQDYYFRRSEEANYDIPSSQYDTEPAVQEEIKRLSKYLDDKDVAKVAYFGDGYLLPLIEAIGPFTVAKVRLEQFAQAKEIVGFLKTPLSRLESIVLRLPPEIRVTLDPTERHGFEYQSWFGFTIYAEGVGGALGRGGSYRILGKDEPAIGFSLYPDHLIDALAVSEPVRDTLFLPLGHDPEHAARLRALGWRTVAAICAACDPAALGCTHRLEGGEAVGL